MPKFIAENMTQSLPHKISFSVCMIAILLLALPFLGLASSADTNKYQLIQHIPLKSAYFMSDNLGYSYVVSKHELFKYTSSGALQYQYSNLRLGNITSVDATNPLKILVFYRDFSKILFLDNTLSENTGPLLLEQIGLEQSTLACSSFDNGFWIYSRLNFQLVRFNQIFNRTQTIQNLNQLLGYEISPNFMVEHGSWLYLNNPSTGILVFDIFGTYYKTIPIKNLEWFQLSGERLLYFKDNELHNYHLRKLSDDIIPLPQNNLKMLRVEKERLFILDNDGLNIYSVE